MFNKYDAYKDSGIDWVGKIPASWDVKRLKAPLAERNEKNDPIKTDFILSLTMHQGVIPQSEKTGGGNKPKEDLTAYKLARPNDIVLNSMNVIVGSVGLSKYFGVVSPVYYMLYARDGAKTNIGYYNYIFQSQAFQKNLGRLGTGILIKKSETSGKLNTIRMKISMDDLNNELLPIPSFSEQNKIVDFLDRKTAEIDQAIAIKEQQIALLNERKQIVIQKAVTQGLNPNVAMKDSGVEWIGQIPEHWETSKIRYLGTTQNGISAGGDYFGTGYPFVSYSDVYKNRVLPECVEGLANSTLNDQKSFSVQEGDIFFTRTSETIDEIGFTSVCFKTIENAVFAGFLIRFRPFLKAPLIKEFSKYYFSSPMMRAYFVKEMNLVIRASLSQELLKNLDVLLPDIEEQKAIAEYLDDLTGKIENAVLIKYSEIEKLKEYKTTLINDAVTGKIKVA
ncbi:restriction endonuclease subunit S [Acinetobacter sp. YH01020]|uniref:restriction endonuclease subunit S n=1 Tax=Acinetobacter sp. YH01020 TaxID=2601034 RepID=UPI0015D209D8|nr:restriction endonuclease subunit S [Acinetobacter sp. YH01020]